MYKNSKVKLNTPNNSSNLHI